MKEAIALAGLIRVTAKAVNPGFNHRPSGGKIWWNHETTHDLTEAEFREVKADPCVRILSEAPLDEHGVPTAVFNEAAAKEVLEKQAARHGETLASLQAQLDAAKSENLRLGARVQALEVQVKDRDSALADLRGVLAKRVEALDKAAADLRQAQADYTEAEKMAEDLDAKNKELAKANKELQKKLDAAKPEVEADPKKAGGK